MAGVHTTEPRDTSRTEDDTPKEHADHPDEASHGKPDLPQPSVTLNLYRRLAFGRKHLFAPSNTSPAPYFVVNPIPQKHALQWKPKFYRGDNPKHTPTSRAVARAYRTAFWNSFRIELGDGVHEVLENKRRVSEQNSYRRKQKFRKAFCMGEKPPKKELEEEQEVKGLVMMFKMRRKKFLNRTLTWELGGKEYRWTGTRMFSTGWSKGMKGMSHSLKLVDSDGNLVATFAKDRWSSYSSSIKSEGPPNKKKTFLGTLCIYPSSFPDARPAPVGSGRGGNGGVAEVPDASKKPNKEEKHLNLGGTHDGNLTEEAIAFTCWIAVEGEHRLRYKIFDLIEEIAENAGGE